MVLECVTGTLTAPDNPDDYTSDDSLVQPIELHSPSSAKFSTRSMCPHPSDPTPVLKALAPDIHALWTDPAVQALLKCRGVHLEHSARFFLNDVLRIGKPRWQPT